MAVYEIPGHSDRIAGSARDALRLYWDADAATYDQHAEHGAWSQAERAAWSATLLRLLPPPPARILDVGAGTGFLSLALARLGYEVAALDISAGMLRRLRAAAGRERLPIETIHGAADTPPLGPFDAVIERLVLWTLPDPATALAAWRAAAPRGRLIAFEGLFMGRDYLEGIRRRARRQLRRTRGLPPEHHAPYPSRLAAALPLVSDTSPNAMIEVVTAAGWSSVELTRLRDVEWARQLALPPFDRLFGVTPEYAIAARA